MSVVGYNAFILIRNVGLKPTHSPWKKMDFLRLPREWRNHPLEVPLPLLLHILQQIRIGDIFLVFCILVCDTKSLIFSGLHRGLSEKIIIGRKSEQIM